MVEDERLRELLRGTELEDDPRIQRLLAAAAGTPSEYEQEQAARLVKLELVRQMGSPFSETGLSSGGVYLGETLGGRTPGFLNENELSRHLLSVGRPGAGKTNFFMHLMNEVDCPWWVFDLKQDYRHLVRQDSDVLVVPLEELRWNVLQPPPGVDEDQWVQTFAELFADSQALLDASRNYTLRKTRELFELAEDESVYPSVKQLLLYIIKDGVNYTRKQSNYRDTVLNRLNGVLQDANGVFDCHGSYPFDDLLERNVVFEMDGRSTATQNFVMELLLAWIHEYRKAQNHRGSGVRHLLFFDEAKTMFSRNKEEDVKQGIPEIDRRLARLREFQEGVVAADQEASKLTESLKANTKSKVLFSTGSREELDEVAGAMSLTELQRLRAEDLGVGEAVVHVQGRDPCLVRVPRVDVEKSVTNEELRECFVGEWRSFQREAEQDGEVYIPFDSDDDVRDSSEAESGSRSLEDY